MMIGTFRWNLWVGLASMILTFIVSISSNIFMTSLLRSLYAYILVFVLMFGFRWILGSVVGLKAMFNPTADNSEEQVGNSVDVSTPDEADELHKMLKNPQDRDGANLDEQVFTPLSPPKLTTKTDMTDEDLAKALRRMSEE